MRSCSSTAISLNVLARSPISSSRLDLYSRIEVSVAEASGHCREGVNRGSKPEAEKDRYQDSDSRQGEREREHLLPELEDRGSLLSGIELDHHAPACLGQETGRGPHLLTAVVAHGASINSLLAGQCEPPRTFRIDQHHGARPAPLRTGVPNRVKRARSSRIRRHDQQFAGLPEARVILGQLEQTPAVQDCGEEAHTSVIARQGRGVGHAGGPLLRD